MRKHSIKVSFILKQENHFAVELVTSVTDYYEKFIATGLTVIQEEIEKKNDELDIAKQSSQSLSNILKDQQMYSTK